APPPPARRWTPRPRSPPAPRDAKPPSRDGTTTSLLKPRALAPRLFLDGATSHSSPGQGAPWHATRRESCRFYCGGIAKTCKAFRMASCSSVNGTCRAAVLVELEIHLADL